jgi:pilus assembly protein FimV
MKSFMKYLVAGTILLSLWSPAFAVGLGDIDLKSRLNQRMDADIPVLVDAETDVIDINVRLADSAYFKRAGLKRNAVVIGLTFEAVRLNAEQMVIKVRSRDVIKEPMVSFIVEVEHKGARSMREYTALLETPH